MPLFHYGPTTCIPLSIIYLKYRLTTRWAGPPPYAWRRTRGSGCSLPRRQERSGTTMLLFFGKQKNIGNKRSSGASRARWWHWLAGWRNRRGTALGYVRRRRRKKRGEECWTRWSWTMSDVVKAKKVGKKNPAIAKKLLAMFLDLSLKELPICELDIFIFFGGTLLRHPSYRGLCVSVLVCKGPDTVQEASFRGFRHYNIVLHFPSWFCLRMWPAVVCL